MLYKVRDADEASATRQLQLSDVWMVQRTASARSDVASANVKEDRAPSKPVARTYARRLMSAPIS